jgi:shikimate kinase
MLSGRIFLIGMPGSGKSTLGQQLANHFKMNFIDLDVQIVKLIGKSIASIFDDEGEEHFRKLETESLKQICQYPGDFVLATGGGTPCFHNNMEFINESGTSIYLDVPIQEINNRLINSELASRPLFNKWPESEMEAKLAKQRHERSKFYKQANYTLSGSQISLESLISILNK